MYNELMKKMINSGIWEGKPFSDAGLAKKFKHDFEQFVQDKSYMVKEDKVAVASSKCEEITVIAQLNIVGLASAHKDIET